MEWGLLLQSLQAHIMSIMNIEYFKIPPKVSPLTYLQLEPVTADDSTFGCAVEGFSTPSIPQASMSGMM